MKALPQFSRAQHGVILLLGAALLLLWGWRANFGQAPSPPPPLDLSPVFVEVAGAAGRPGVYQFEQPPVLSDLWRLSGAPGTAPSVPDRLASGSRVGIGPDGRYQLGRMAGAQLLTLGLPIDLNTANAEDLDALPSLGPTLAKRIIDYRQKHGPFKKIADLEKVPGIGSKKLEKISASLIINNGDKDSPGK